MKHVHADLMALYAQDAQETDTPWTRWQVMGAVRQEWVPLLSHPEWTAESGYRRKPKTVTINGVELEDDRVSPEEVDSSVEYWCESPAALSWVLSTSPFSSASLADGISRGAVHKTKEGAARFCAARFGISVPVLETRPKQLPKAPWEV